MKQKAYQLIKFFKELQKREIPPFRIVLTGLCLSFMLFLVVIMWETLEMPAWIEIFLAALLVLLIAVPFILWVLDGFRIKKYFPFAIGHEANRKIRLITVHGTGAGDESESGQKWWQLGSSFLTELNKRLDLDPSKVEIIPFQWELGPNSEITRREAGKALYEYLLFNEESEYASDYYLIGHSHGGSVIYHSLLQSITKARPLNRLKCWCTVATPFLDYRQNRWLFQRLEGISLAVFITGLIALFLGFVIWTNLVFNADGLTDDINFFTYMGSLLLIYGLISVAGLYVYERLYKNWHTRPQKIKVAEEYFDRWLGFWHQEDEAISALSNIKTIQSPIIPNTFLRPFAGVALLLSIIGLGFYAAYDVSVNNGDLLRMLTGDLLIDIDLNTAPNLMDALKMLLLIGASIIVFLLFAYILSIVFSFWSIALGFPLSKVFNGLIWLSVRQRAWGDDLVKEDVYRIGSQPPEFINKYGPLPNPVAESMSDHSQEQAAKTLSKMRKVLGMAQDSDSVGDLKADLSENLTWNELIHCSYFENPEFIDLLALGLHQNGLGELKEIFTLTPERERLMAWCLGTERNSNRSC